MTDILLVAAWGAVVLAAIDGWGGLAAILTANIAIDAGLRLAWGMAAMLAIGGVLTALSLATQPVVVGVVLAGVVLALPRWRRDASWRWIGPMGCAAGLILALHYLGQVAGVKAVCTDDHVAYWGFIKRQLVLGAVDEPFSLRRLAGHGGQMFLQSLVDAEGGLDNSFLVERGIAPIVIYLLLRGAMPGRGPVLPALALTMTLVTLVYEFNSQSLCTGIVLFLGLARTLLALDIPARTRPGELILLGLLVAGASSLRVQFLPGAALTVGLWMLPGWREIRALPALSWRVAVIAGSSVVFFTPWMVGLWISSGTPLFPLFPGTGAGGYDAFSSEKAMFYDLALKYAASPGGVFLLIPILALWRPSPERRVLVITYAVALLVTLLFSWRFPTAEPWDLARYVWPMAVVPVFLSASIAARAARLETAGRPVLIALVAGGLLISVLKLNQDSRQLVRALDPDESAAETRLAEMYRKLQDLVPAGETLLVATDNPYLVDYRRNRTWNLDLPGAASPPPGMPFFRGPEVMRDYLLAKGVHYVLFADGMQANPCLYDRPRYSSREMLLAPALWQQQSHYVLDFMNNMDRLAAQYSVLGRMDDTILLRLDER